MPWNCLSIADNFCYICGEVTFANQKKDIASNAKVKKAYHLYFRCKIGDQDKSWAPHICCRTCATNLSQWINGKRKLMPFAVPMVWREPSNHITDCYFSMVPPVSGGITKKKKWAIAYPNIPSASQPVPHGEGLLVPEPLTEVSNDPSDDGDEMTLEFPGPSTSDGHQETDPDFSQGASSVPHRITQEELNYLVRDLELSKSKAELLGSRLQQWNLLQENVRVTLYRKRHLQLKPFFRKVDKLVFCSDVNSLLNVLGIQHDPQEWRLFIDSSKMSLKAVLLLYGNRLPSIPVRHAVDMKETYDNVKQLLDCLDYSKYGWHICSDLKVVTLLIGLQLGYTKYCCFLCEWDNR
ncbi:hypothetical protein P4O66_003802 [Electrophorus voltai]|uniref:Uncharacterized protein n=1 Tax=Electrophorus voltai TaxID=2609070 RepID=A0AAD8ZUT3_9TELE|nr:hypothetical protein P4O66_003802 [Electrophorus voltai]